ncbi:MAG: beta strand repeat-containing protein [Phycisphaerae bacterium]
MKNQTSRIVPALAAAALALAVQSAFADPGVSYSGGTYTQDFNSFNTLGNMPPVTFGSLSLNPIVIGPTPVGSAPIDLTGPSADGNLPQISGLTGWYADSFGGNSSALTYEVDDGSSVNVGLKGYFDPAQQSAGNNLAIGALTGSASGNVVFGVRLVNTGSTTLNAISLSYTGELFHEDAGPKTLLFGYTVDPTGTASIPSSNLTAVGSLNVTGFDTGLPGAVANSPSSTKNLSVINLPLATAWAPNQALWLTWTASSAGGGQGLGIDNLSFSASNVTVFSALTWSHASDGNWNTTDVNWKDSSNTSTSFANNNNVVFGDLAANATITVDPAGVTIQQSANITNNSATTYTFTGGSIGGTSASLNINGSGTVKLTSPNTYGLATNVNAGTLVVSSDNQLGASTATVTLNGGTLKLAGPIDSSNRVLTVSEAGATINLNGFNALFGASSANIARVNGVLTVTGGGNLDLGAAPAFATSGKAPYGSLTIDAGNSVTIHGNGRSSAIDMYAGGVLNGDLILDNTPVGSRFNFNSPGDSTLGVDHNGDSKFTGTGRLLVMNGSGWVNVSNTTVPTWQLDTTGTVISNTSKTYAAEIDVNVVLNAGNHPFTPVDVITADFTNNNPNPTNSFVTAMGGTKIGSQGHGPSFSNLIIKGVISGNSDIQIGNDYKGGGSGDMTWYAHNTYAGTTMIDGGGGLYTAIDDALPTTTNVVFGAIFSKTEGLVDLDGHSQHVQSISVALGSNTPQGWIIQNSGPSDATLYITGNNTPLNPYVGLLNDGGQNTDGTVGTHTLALSKSGNGILVLGEYVYADHTTTSNYSGGTTVSGGTLEIAFDGALGAPTGNLTMDGGTLSVRNPFFIGSPDGTESTVSFSSDRPLTVTSNGGTILTPAFNATLQASSSTVSLVEPVTLSGNGGYHWGGTLQYTGAPGSSLTINGGSGSVVVTGSAAVQANAGSTILVGGASDPFTDSSNANAHVAVISDGLVRFTSGAKAVSALSGTGAVQIDAGATLTSDGAQVATLLVDGTQVIRPNATAAGTSKVNALTLAGGSGNWIGHLELSGNKLIVEAASKATAMATLQEQIAYGGSNAAGITSSGLGANFALAVMDNGILGKSTFGGVAVDAGSILVSPELLGDSNADGKVDLTDLSTVLNHFGVATSAWTSGNFDGGATIDLTDLSNVLNNFGVTNANASDLPAALASSGGAITATPEPGSLALAGLGAVALLRRRKRA